MTGFAVLLDDTAVSEQVALRDVVMHREVLARARRFSTIRFEHVPRERNKEADRLANEGVDDWLAGRR